MVQQIIKDNPITKYITVSDLLGHDFGNKIIFYKTNNKDFPVFLKAGTFINSLGTEVRGYGFVSPVFDYRPTYVTSGMHTSIEAAMTNRTLYVINKNNWKELFKIM